MAEDNLDQIIADNQQETEQIHNNQSSSSDAPAHPAEVTEHHAADSPEHEEQDVFSSLLSQMGDHHGFYIGSYKILDLPMILIDGSSIDIYPSMNAMEEGGIYTMHHRKVVKKSTLQQEHPEAPALDLSITNLIFMEFIALFLLSFIFIKVGRKYKKNPSKAPSGLQNMIESVVIYVRDEIVRPNLPTVQVADRLLHYFIGLFFFILFLNLSGLFPGAHTATGVIGVTCGLAITAFIVINYTAIKESGIGAWFKHLLGGAPWWLFFVMIPIELLSLFIKPFALTIRLFANMSAGHVVLLSLLGLIFYFKTILIAPAIVGFSVFIYFLELLVAFIQAYVFTMLTAIFVGLAIGEHGHDEEHLGHEH